MVTRSLASVFENDIFQVMILVGRTTVLLYLVPAGYDTRYMSNLVSRTDTKTLDKH